MGPDIDISVVKDTATPRMAALRSNLSPASIKRAVGRDCTQLVKDHLGTLGPNKRGWPSTGFYAGAARGTTWNPTSDGIVISIDNADRPGAMRQRYHGGPIDMKDKMLTIPAAPQFYGHSATEFTNLRLAVFGGGLLALVVGTGGTGRVNFVTGREQRVSGAGTRARGMVAYWLKEHVDQDADPGVLPTEQELVDDAIGAVVGLVRSKGVAA